MKILKKLALLLLILIATLLVFLGMGVELSGIIPQISDSFNHAIRVLTSWDNLEPLYLAVKIIGVAGGAVLVLLSVIGFIVACVKYTKKNDANPIDFINCIVFLGIIFFIADLARANIPSRKVFFGVVLGVVALLGLYVLYLFVHVCRLKKEVEVTPAPAVEETPAPVEETPVVEEVKPVEEAPVVEETPVEPTPVVEEPVVEETPAPVEEPVVATPAVEEPVERTYSLRLQESDKELLEAYSLLKNQLLKHRKVHTRITKSCETFRVGYDQIAKIIVAGKGLKLYLAKDPLSEDSAIYHQRDASSKNNFVEVPFVVKVKSNLSIRKALQLIDMMCEEKGIEFKSRYEEVDYSNLENNK